jgi:hypothetical protein
MTDNFSPVPEVPFTYTAKTWAPNFDNMQCAIVEFFSVALLATILTLLFARKLRFLERLIFWWFAFDAGIHTFFEGPFVIASLRGRFTGGVATSDLPRAMTDRVIADPETVTDLHCRARLRARSFVIINSSCGCNLSFICVGTEYGKSDFRWLYSDPGIVSMEVATVGMEAPLCWFILYLILKKSSWRHPIQFLICVGELYGLYMTFAPEWIYGSPNLDGSTFLYYWIYLGSNWPWLFIPLALTIQSMRASANGIRVAESIKEKGSAANGVAAKKKTK